MAHFVLVHGAWHGAWCWRKLVPELEKLGHTAAPIDLPGLGDDRTPASGVTLDDYAARIVRALDTQPEPVILLGHSMGGIAITAAAEQCPGKIRWLAYLTAFLPREGESLIMLEERNGDPRVPPHIIPDKENFIARINLDKVDELFYHDCSAEDAAYAKARIRPQSFLPLTAPVQISDTNFGKIPRAYIECTDDRAIVVAFQREMLRASPCDRVFSLNTGHAPFLSAPQELARILAELAEDQHTLRATNPANRR